VRPSVLVVPAGDSLSSAPGCAEARTAPAGCHTSSCERGRAPLRGARGRGRRPHLAPDQGAA
jgi:hypothetical protein